MHCMLLLSLCIVALGWQAPWCEHIFISDTYYSTSNKTCVLSNKSTYTNTVMTIKDEVRWTQCENDTDGNHDFLD